MENADKLPTLSIIHFPFSIWLVCSTTFVPETPFGGAFVPDLSATTAENKATDSRKAAICFPYFRIR